MNDPKIDTDYQDFINSVHSDVPEHLTRKILDYVKKDLNPNFRIVFFKLTLIQAIAGVITLLFCPQFSISITGSHSLFHIFHGALGIYGCMAVCGSIFVGAGAFSVPFILKIPELRKLHKYNIVYFSAIAFLSLLTFSIFGESMNFELVISWLLGAISGGLLIFELTQSLKKKLTFKNQ